MEAKEFLEQFGRYDAFIKNKKEELKSLEDEATNITSHLTPDKVQTSGSKQKMAEAVEMCIDLKNQIIEYIKLREKARADITQVIETLPTESYDVLHKHYIQLKSIQEIAIIYDRTVNRVYQKRDIAIKDVQKRLDEINCSEFE